MSTLHAFGDSYTYGMIEDWSDPDNKHRGRYPNSFIKRLAKHFNLKLRNHAGPGQSNNTQLQKLLIELVHDIPEEETVSVSQFFRLYDQLFYDIPPEGEINTHEFLIRRSTEYIGFTDETPEEIQALLDEITNLRRNLLDTEQEVLDLRNQLSNQ